MGALAYIEFPAESVVHAFSARSHYRWGVNPLTLVGQSLSLAGAKAKTRRKDSNSKLVTCVLDLPFRTNTLD